MATRRRRKKLFLETSGVIYKLHGHTLMKLAVDELTSDGSIMVSNFVRMEYLRGYVSNLIELYFLIGESESVSDALIDWSQKVMQDRKLKVALMTVPQWLTNQEDWDAKNKSMRRLGDLAVRAMYNFDHAFRNQATDRLQCELGRQRFPRRSFSEALLLDFYERFSRVRNGTPSCALCQFRESTRRRLDAKRVDLYSDAQRAVHRSNKGYVKQAERLHSVLEQDPPIAKCRICERLGDTVIATHVSQKACIVTADRAFEAFGKILDVEVRLLPSLAELKRRRTEA